MHRCLGVLALLALVQAAEAEEKFYSIVGPDGGVQIIRSTAEPDNEKPSASGKEERPEPSGDGASTAAKKKTRKPGPSAPAATAEGGPAAAAGAAYDSDEYADSEQLESPGARAGGKERFYIIQDGLGSQQVSDSDGESVYASDEEGAAAPEDRPVQEFFRQVDEGMLVRPAEEATKAFPLLPGCLGKAEIETARPIEPGAPETLVIGKETYVFLKDSRVAAAYRLGGAGLRTLVSSSFSRTDRKPGFVHPHLAFFDDRGCLSRVVSNFYESLYPASQRRHPMLKARLAVHAEETFMLVLLPRDGGGKTVAALPYEYSRLGQLKFTVKRQ